MLYTYAVKGNAKTLQMLQNSEQLLLPGPLQTCDIMKCQIIVNIQEYEYTARLLDSPAARSKDVDIKTPLRMVHTLP